MYMLHKMSEVRGWSHEDMMAMDKRIFYRYYGYWYSERLKESIQAEQQKKEQERKSKSANQPKNWKTL